MRKKGGGVVVVRGVGPNEKGGIITTNCRTWGASVVFLLIVQGGVLDGSGKTAVAMMLPHKLLNV